MLAGAVALSACGNSGDERARPADAAAAVDSAGIRAESGRIVFLGTSLTAGLGVAVEDAYPALVQQRIDSAGWPFHVVNAGVSGETSAGGLARLDWLLRQPMDVLVIELGVNDGLRGQDVDTLRANLQRIIDRTRNAYPHSRIVLAGMETPPNLGAAYAGRFRRTFADLARANDAALIPFLLDGVAADRELNQADGIHPTEAGHTIIAETVWRVLEPVLRAGSRLAPLGGTRGDR